MSSSPIPQTCRRKVLVAMDGSDHSATAFKWYVSAMHREGDYVILAHVPEYHGFVHMPVIAVDPALVTRMVDEEEKSIRLLVGRLKEMLVHAGIEGKIVRLQGKPGEEIVKCASELGVTLVVTGTRGQGTLRRTFMGSVSNYIVHHSHVPVLVCRHTDDAVA